MASAASANFVWAAERARFLSAQVAEHFAEAADIALPDLRFDQSQNMAAKVDPLAQPDGEGFGVGQRLITGMRGGYGGMLMIGMATTLAGLALLNPISIGAGLLFGTKTVRDERKRMLQRRQAEAKQAVRKPHRRGDVPGRQGLPRHAAPHPAPAARPLQLAGRGGQHVDHELGAGRAERASPPRRRSGESRIRDLKAELARIDALADRAKALVANLPDQVPLAVPSARRT